MFLGRDSVSGVYRWLPNLKVLQENLVYHLLLVPERRSWTLFEKPTLILGADRSGYIPRDSHDDIRAVFPRAQIDYVPNSTHFLFIDNPEGFLARLIPFAMTSSE